MIYKRIKKPKHLRLKNGIWGGIQRPSKTFCPISMALALVFSTIATLSMIRSTGFSRFL